MPFYRFALTRNVTETALVVVEADDISAAHSAALTRSFAEDPSKAIFSKDEGSEDHTYLPDHNDYEEVSADEAAEHFRRLERPYRFFSDTLEVKSYVESEFLATLEDDLRRMSGSERDRYTDQDRTEMTAKIADVRALLERWN